MNPKAIAIIAFMITATVATAMVFGAWMLIPLGLFAAYTLYGLF